MQNFPNSDDEAVRSGCVEVADQCSPTIFNCKLTSLSTGKFTKFNRPNTSRWLRYHLDLLLSCKLATHFSVGKQHKFERLY